MQVTLRIDPLEHVTEHRHDVVDVQLRIVFPRSDQHVLRQRQLPLAQDRVGTRQQLHRPTLARIRHVPLAANRQQQGMNSRCIHRVNRMHARHHRRDRRTGQLMNDLAKRRVLLRRPPHNRERPHRVATVIHLLDPHHRKVVSQAVITQVITKRTLGQQSLGINRPHQAEIRLGRHRQVGAPADQPHPSTAQCPGKRQFGQSLGQGHHGRESHHRGATNGHRHTQWFTPLDRRRVVEPDRPVDLVMQPRLAVGLVLVAGELNPVHAQVRIPPARSPGILGVDLWQGDERTTVIGPVANRRKFRKLGGALGHGTSPHQLGTHRPRRA